MHCDALGLRRFASFSSSCTETTGLHHDYYGYGSVVEDSEGLSKYMILFLVPVMIWPIVLPGFVH